MLARAAFVDGSRNFLAVGGDGTALEVLNGALGAALDEGEDISFGVLPLGTGNSWSRSFEPPDNRSGDDQGLEQTLRCLHERRSRRLDVLRVHHDDGETLALSFVSIGLAAEVSELCNSRLKWLGASGYQVGAFLRALRSRPIELDVVVRDGTGVETWRGPVTTFGAHNVSLFGGALPIAPDADPGDGLIDCVVVGAVGRLELLRALPSLRVGEHLGHPAVRTLRGHRVDIQDPEPRDVLLDGEVRRLTVQSIEILPAVAEFWI